MTQPLRGKRVVVTRPRDQAAEFVSLLLELGAVPIEAPMISIVPPDNDAPLEAACAAASSFDWIIFTSSNGVDAFMDRLLSKSRDARILDNVHLCAIGPATASRLTEYQLKIDLVPKEHHGDAVADALRRHVHGARVLLPRANLAQSNLPDALREAGADVVDVAAYRTIPTTSLSNDVCKAFLERRIDVVTFTSASTVHNFVKLFGKEYAVDLFKTSVIASIGPVTAEAARKLGIDTTIMPETHTVIGLVQAIEDYFRQIDIPN